MRQIYPVLGTTGPFEEVGVHMYMNHKDMERMIEVGTGDSAIRMTMPEFLRELPPPVINRQLVKVYLYLRQPGKVINLSFDHVMQTYDYLEGNI